MKMMRVCMNRACFYHCEFNDILALLWRFLINIEYISRYINETWERFWWGCQTLSTVLYLCMKRLKDNFRCKYNLFLWAQFCGLGIVDELSVWSLFRAVLNGLTSVVVKKSVGYVLSFVPLIWEVDIRCFGKRPFFSLLNPVSKRNFPPKDWFRTALTLLCLILL